MKIGFVDTFGAIEEFFTEQLSHVCEFERDDQNPHILFFGDRNFGDRNELPQYQNCIRVFYTGENERPEHYHCHFAISFDHIEDDRSFRLPLYVIYDWDNRRKKVANIDTRMTALYKLVNNHNPLKQDRGFCSFIVKNPGCEKRNLFFQALNAYKPVASAGPLFNNVGEVLARGDQSVQSKLAYLPKFKFNLCFENSSYPGYATEKLYEAFMGDTIPIYWGSPTIECDFNPKAFLNWHDYGNDKDFFEAIIKVDQDDRLYSSMYLQPMFSHGPSKFFDLTRLQKFLKTITDHVK